jgi:hypothetical protein
LAKFQINDIKTRGIIVRLRTDKDRIAAYRKKGNTKIADEIENDDKSVNLLLMYSFITQWSYCPIYFMETQHTAKLLGEDTLIAKTFDLKRDTSIYMDHDSFYIIDYGDLMASDFDGNHPYKTAGESNTPLSGKYLVIKDHTLSQLYPPIPFHSKIWLDGFPSPDKFILSDISQSLNDSMTLYLNKYHTTVELLKSEAKHTTQQFLDSLYIHIYINFIGKGKTNADSSFSSSYTSAANSAYVVKANNGSGHVGSTKTIVQTYDAVGEPGTTLQKGTQRLNTFLISYYCIRLDKDKNILSRDDLPYWWQRNPNIRYLLNLRQIETELMQNLKEDYDPTTPYSKSNRNSSKQTVPRRPVIYQNGVRIH